MTPASMGVIYIYKKILSHFKEEERAEAVDGKTHFHGQHRVAMRTSAVNRLQLETNLELCMWNQLNTIRLQLGG